MSIYNINFSKNWKPNRGNFQSQKALDQAFEWLKNTYSEKIYLKLKNKISRPDLWGIAYPDTDLDIFTLILKIYIQIVIYDDMFEKTGNNYDEQYQQVCQLIYQGDNQQMNIWQDLLIELNHKINENENQNNDLFEDFARQFVELNQFIALERDNAQKYKQQKQIIPNLQEFIELRANTISTIPMCNFLKLQFGKNRIKDELFEKLVRLQAKIIGLFNELVSLQKDLKDNQLNFVIVLAQQKDCIDEQDIKKSVDMINELIQEFEQICEQCQEQDQQQQPIINSLKHMTYGLCKWQSEVGRYDNVIILKDKSVKICIE